MAKHISKTELIRLNTEHWSLANFHPSALAQAKSVAARLVAPKAKAIYLHIEQATGVPWFIVAVIHEREAGQRWDRQLGQGDPLNQVSRHVPKGRGPFSSFIDGAIDALVNCPPYAAKWKDWTPGGALTLTELYNGTGYEDYHHMASPYVWGGTDIYHVGKYVADGKFDASVEDHQLGTAVLIKEMMELDPDVRFASKSEYVPPQPVPIPPERPAKAQEEDDTERDQPPAPVPAPEPASPPPAAQEQSSNPNEGKPAHKSKITWLSWLMSFLGLGGLSNNFGDATIDTVNDAVNKVQDSAGKVHDLAQHVTLSNTLLHLLGKPSTIVFIGIIACGVAIAFFWYRDHGPGSQQ